MPCGSHLNRKIKDNPLVFSIPGVHVLNKVKIKQTNRNYLIHNYFMECNPYIQK